MTVAKSISVQELARQEEGPLEIIDVRTPAEFNSVHAVSARNIPLDQLDPAALMQSRNGSAELPLYLICKSGTRGNKAQNKFADAGYDNVINVEGGTEAWAAAGLPVVRGKAMISLERQTRIAAGFIVMAGGAAAIALDNAYIAALPAAVGAGLMLAGIFDSCLMGMMLARMPWNR